VNIGISLVDFTPGRMGGVETYIRNLVSWLAVNDHENEYTLICTNHNVAYFDDILKRVNTLVFENSKNSPYRILRSLVRKVFRVDMIQNGIDRLGLDLLHNPLTYVRDSRSKTPLIVTFHDLQHHYYPEFFRAREIQSRDRMYRRAALEADTIIADSEYTRQTLLDSYGVSYDRVQVVHLGVGSEYNTAYEQDFLLRERSLLGLHKPFLYYPAATWQHKNHANLLQAVSLLSSNHHFDGNLVLTGVATSAKDDLLKNIAARGLQDRVQILGYLPYDKLPVIYNLARMMVFPSLFEGFGMPVLEAMACGCPVACSNVTSLPEVGGDAVLYFDPLSAEQIADSVMKLWHDDAALLDLRAKGLERARQFSWEKTARETLAVYHRTIRELKNR
jgi:glycosyltransferase involved in cell wall biosynthesis